MAQISSATILEDRPYPASWFDRFTDWVETISFSSWVFYIGLALALILIQLTFLWLEGAAQTELLLPVIVFNSLAVSYVLALTHLLDRQALASLQTLHPTLTMTEAAFHQIEYRLTTMPSRPALLAGALMIVFGVLLEQLGIQPLRYAALADLPRFSIVYHLTDKASMFVFGVFVYHTVRQLRLVDQLYLHHVKINLFDLKPLQAFSRLTTATAMGLLLGMYGWMIINPELLTNPWSLGFTLAFSLLAVAVLIWPLYGAHRQMQQEKERMLHEIDVRFEAASTAFNQGFEKGEFKPLERGHAALAGLEIQRARVLAIPTWPWRPETLRFALAAIALPLALRVIQFVIERAFNL